MSQPSNLLSSDSGTAKETSDDAELSPKRQRFETTKNGAVPTNKRRKTACQACRMRKVKCDAVRPTCGICKASDSVCHYTDPLPERWTIDSATELLSNKLDRLQNDIDRLHHLSQPTESVSTSIDHEQGLPFNPDHPRQSSAIYHAEPSKDFLSIPAARTTADSVLTWPVFGGRYDQSALISILFLPESSNHDEDVAAPCDSFVVPGGLIPPNEESIPILVDRFLENVHTKNPVLDVEQLVKHSRNIASNGLGWNAWSCLVLLASALGTIAKPFDAAVNVAPSPVVERQTETTWITDAPTTPQELQQAESLFVLACRRMGCLKHTILGSHCYFFAGVYLMYTLRPLLSWQYFIQSSILYQLYMKKTHALATDLSQLGQIPVERNLIADSKKRRLEESMYWSCFKSESEFRVELPLPQSEIATYFHPQMFPSPPSPADVERNKDGEGAPDSGHPHGGENTLIEPGISRKISNHPTEAEALRQHAKQLCNEEESWYYYLTEIALRRIGNRIINTFFNQDPATWLDIKPLLSIALEFDTQVSAWSAHLPAAMQHFESNSTIRAPSYASTPDGIGNHVSRELSWATDNRLLEMRSWLYQPFLYYFIHSQANDNHFPSRIPTLEEFVQTLCLWNSSFGTEDATVLYHFITSGIDCNLKILDVRSLRHRHHGLWYDMRSLMCASLILLALVKSGREAWIPDGAEILWGPQQIDQSVGGRIGHIISEFEYWAQESPDLRRHIDVLEDVTKTVRAIWFERQRNSAS